jgi:hypothetical protein
MIKLTHLLIASAAALAFSDAASAQVTRPNPPGESPVDQVTLSDACGAQGTLPAPLPDAPPAAVPAAGRGDGILQALPQPRDLPTSLFAPPPPPSSTYVPVDMPYLLRDPLLDRPQLPPPGWFFGGELQVLKPHVLSRLRGSVQNSMQKAAGTSTTVALSHAPLDWTVSPRLFLGYRLPSGFGEFAVAYRFLDASGGEALRASDGPATLKSRLSFNMIDFDYSNSELSIWPKWDMRWTAGLRVLTLFTDSRGNQPFSQAAAGSGIFQTRDFINPAGVGPHVALDLARHLGDSGWSLRCKGDFGAVFTSGHEGFFAESTTLGQAGRPLAGDSSVFFHQGTSIINIQAGLSWQPSPSSATRFFLGYQYERWFALEGVVDSGSHGQLWDQGVVLQATLHF